jgi:transposase
VIQITVQTRILVAIQAVDFRKGMDGLARVCQEQLQTAPFSGGLFVFRNRRRTALKVLAYDGRGFGLCQMRLSRGRFPFWPASATGTTKALEAHEFYVLLAGGDPDATTAVPVWRPVSLPA